MMNIVPKGTSSGWKALLRRVVAFAAVVLGAGLVSAFWLRLAPSAGSLAFLVPGTVGLAAFLLVEEYTRIRGRRRLRAALDAYAERELQQERRRRALERSKALLRLRQYTMRARTEGDARPHRGARAKSGS
jgi:hypothetical protein